MTALIQAIPLATADRLHGRLGNLARSFQEQPDRFDSGQLVACLIGAAVVVLAIWIWAHFTERREGRSQGDNSLSLFLALGKAHQLRWRDTWLLWKLARAQGIDEPARVFLEPARLEAGHLPASLARQRSHLAQLAERLFG